MGCKTWLKLLAGLAFIGLAMGYLNYSPWLVLGVYFLLRGIMPFFCKCECCSACDMGMGGKKKR